MQIRKDSAYLALSLAELLVGAPQSYDLSLENVVSDCVSQFLHGVAW